MTLESEIVIVGAGAAGLWAAGVAARRGRAVLLLEKTARTGTKVLASGGTRCNLTTTLDAEGAAALFRPRGARFLRHAFGALPPRELRERFDALGVPTVDAPMEKVFPKSDRARDVRDALEREARAAGVRIELDANVVGVEGGAGGEQPWLAHIAGGRRATCTKLLLCPGGMSYPRTGTTGEGYGWLAKLGLPVRPPVPALVPLTSPAAWVRELSGIAWQAGEVRLLDPRGKVLGRRRRPLLFTHFGVSGPAAMDLSVHVARAQADGEPGEPSELTLALDLLPDVSRADLRGALVEAAAARGAPRLSRTLAADIPKRLLAAISRAARLAEADPPVAGIARAHRHDLIETLKGLRIPIDGTQGFDRAEVTAGGLALEAVDPRTMAVNGHPGLYVFGELLDLDGPIGGLNFQAAFACAELAALDAARLA